MFDGDTLATADPRRRTASPFVPGSLLSITELQAVLYLGMTMQPVV